MHFASDWFWRAYALENECAHLLISKLETFVATDEMEVEHLVYEYRVPVSWWQHFKQEVFPTWALRKWPVEERTVTKNITVKHVALYPEFNKAINGSQINIPWVGKPTYKVRVEDE